MQTAECSVDPLLDALDTGVHGAWFDSIGIILLSHFKTLSSLISAAHLNSAQPQARCQDTLLMYLIGMKAALGPNSLRSTIATQPRERNS